MNSLTILQLKTVRVCGPRYWPQVIELNPEGSIVSNLVSILLLNIITCQPIKVGNFSEKPWWNAGDKDDPFNSGILYIKRKVGACSYVDDPIGCQSLLSRAMHKV